jgi:DNA-binding IclR family transcriptional regulator
MSNSRGAGPGEGDGVGAVQSVDRALAILELLAGRPELGVTEIAAELGVHKSTAFRLVTTLEQHRLVEQLGERGKYQLGFGLVRLAGAATTRLDLAREALPVCRRLAAVLNETVNLAVRDGDAAVNVSQEQGAATVSIQNWIGHRTPLHATSSGKVLLAWMAEDELAPLLAGGLKPYTSHTITEPGQLRAELGRVRERGWAATAEELEIGLNAVAAPVRGAEGAVVAALSVSGPSYRLGPGIFDDVARALRGGADEISREIGYISVPLPAAMRAVQPPAGVPGNGPWTGCLPVRCCGTWACQREHLGGKGISLYRDA